MEEYNLSPLSQELKIRNYSPKTIEAYLYYNKDFRRFINKSLRNVNEADIRKYLEYLSNKKSSQTVSLALNALKFYFQKFYKRQFFLRMRHPKKESKLPVVLSKNEVKKLLGCINNVKHKLLLGLMYSAGLRVSEIVRLRVKDLDFDNQVLYVRGGKGKKDRQTLLPRIMQNILRKYICGRGLEDYVFESSRGGRLTERSVQKVFSQAIKKSKIKKDATCHSLRHSFATHLLEKGVNVRYIQELLGHKRLETTQVYTKVASNKLKKIDSPLDDFI
jgi:site-specific recombinase XerD